MLSPFSQWTNWVALMFMMLRAVYSTHAYPHMHTDMFYFVHSHTHTHTCNSKIGILHADIDTSSRFRRDPRQLDEDEEAWFDDEEEETSGFPPPVSTSELYKKLVGTSTYACTAPSVPHQVKPVVSSPGSPLPGLSPTTPPLFLTSSSYSPRPNAPMKRVQQPVLSEPPASAPTVPVFRSVSTLLDSIIKFSCVELFCWWQGWAWAHPQCMCLHIRLQTFIETVKTLRFGS